MKKGKINFLLFYFLARYMRIEKCTGKEKVVRYLRKVILASHGELSKGMLNSVRMIIGEFGCPVETFSLYPGESALDYANHLICEANENVDDEYVVISDVIGGSVHTALLQTTKCQNIKLISGMNMNMVLELVTTPLDQKLTRSKIDSFVNAGKEGIIFIDTMNEYYESEDF